MKIFIDSADPTQIRQAYEAGIIDGVTTNPSLAAKTGRPYSEIVQEIFDIVEGPVSLEVIATEYEGMVEQGVKLAKLHKNVVVKIPCTPVGIRATKTLKEKKIKVNVTLVFSIAQALLVGKVGADYCSPFVGRLDDIDDVSGDELVAAIRTVYDNYGFETKILAASIRDVEHVEYMAIIGADVVTVPFEVITEMFDHSLTTKGLNKFLQDWNEAGLQLPFE